MENLTYSIYYTPSKQTDKNINYVCSDDKIHVRFRDFDSEQVVSGFEKKLTYLFTYLINFSYVSSLYSICSPKLIMESLLESEDVEKIYKTIKYYKNIDVFKGFRLSINYKKSDCVAFGKLEQEAFPLEYDEFGNPKEANLETFLSILKVDLVNYLFNDAYTIVIHKNYDKDINKKFINKETKKNQVRSDFIQLW